MISRNTINIIICLLLLAPFHAKGALPRSDCTAPLPASINVPSLSVPSTLEVGKDIPGAKASFSIVITCTNTFNGVLHWYVSMDSGAAIQLVASFTDVYTVPGMPAGVGFRIRGPGGAVLIPIVYGTAASTFDFGVAKSPVSVIQGSFELVKTASAIAVGSFSFSTNAHVPSTEYANAGLSSQSALIFGYTINSVTVGGCVVSKSDIAVPLQNVHVPELPTVGSTAYPTPFGIDLLCDSNTRPQISMTDAASPSNQTTELTLAPGSTASGIAIQILSNEVMMHFGPAPISYSGSGAGINNSINLGTVSGATHLPFTARYVRTGAIKPGKVLGRATFTLTYQ